MRDSSRRGGSRARLGWAAAAITVAIGAIAWAGSYRLRTRDAGRSTAPDGPGPASVSLAPQSSAQAPPPAAAAESILHVPRVAGGFAINAETEGKAVWEADTGNTENFVDSGGHGMVPYTAAKVRWGDGKLYFLLYAGDLDLEGKIDKADTPFDKDDSFRLEFSSGDDVRVVAVSVLGRVYDAICRGPVSARKCDSKWQSHAQVAIDRDGTLNRIHDNDEEWVVEMALPLHDLGIVSPGPGTRIRFAVSRCEVGYDGVHACGGWGKGERTGDLALDP